ncbi:regulator of MON1-CCZ1 complex-like isoform X2 [Gordionus sp. m RMFG-2023]|uniref:regulator of MON1-CCZ1 complex-like isoform X2 n=1 Tax=Gordionus sp. m RMFG-2023 TaxID=3053472 RepID=UPI0031FD23F2
MGFLVLNENPLIFPTKPSYHALYFDDNNQQLIIINTYNKFMYINIKSPNHEERNLKLLDKGRVISLKLSADLDILAIQRSKLSIEFINVYGFNENNIILSDEYSQSKKRAEILGFIWLSSRYICYVTLSGCEIYHVICKEKIVKFIRTFNSERIYWYIYLASENLLLLCTGAKSNVLKLIFTKDGNFSKISKIEHFHYELITDLCYKMEEKNFVLAKIYDFSYVLFIEHNRSSSQDQFFDPTTPRPFISLHKILLGNRRCPLTDILVLGAFGLSGSMTINVVDNVIVVHNLTSKNSLIFDLNLYTLKSSKRIYNVPDSDGSPQSKTIAISPSADNFHINIHRPLLPEPISISLPIKCKSVENHAFDKYESQLYTNYWNIFRPDIVIDTKFGFYWNLSFDLSKISDLLPDQETITRFLLNRFNSHYVLVAFLKNLILINKDLIPSGNAPDLKNRLETLKSIFDLIHTNCSDFNQSNSLASNEGGGKYNKLPASPKSSVSTPNQLSFNFSDFHSSHTCSRNSYCDVKCINEKFPLILTHFMIKHRLWIQLKFLLVNHLVPITSSIVNVLISCSIIQTPLIFCSGEDVFFVGTSQDSNNVDQLSANIDACQWISHISNDSLNNKDDYCPKIDIINPMDHKISLTLALYALSQMRFLNSQIALKFMKSIIDFILSNRDAEGINCHLMYSILLKLNRLSNIKSTG